MYYEGYCALIKGNSRRVVIIFYLWLIDLQADKIVMHYNLLNYKIKKTILKCKINEMCGYISSNKMKDCEYACSSYSEIFSRSSNICFYITFQTFFIFFFIFMCGFLWTVEYKSAYKYNVFIEYLWEKTQFKQSCIIFKQRKGAFKTHLKHTEDMHAYI